MKRFTVLATLSALAFGACDSPTEPVGFPTAPEPLFHHSTTISTLTVTPGNGSVSATWSQSTINNNESNQYVVQLDSCTTSACVSSTNVETTSHLTTRSYSRSPLAAGHYRLRVTGHLGGGAEDVVWSSWSHFEVAVTPTTQPQSVTITAPVSATYGDHALTVSASASSGLPVSLSASGPCTLAAGSSPTTATITGVGNCVISATQAGNATYEAAGASHTIVIARAPMTVTADNKSKTYDGAAFSPFTATYSGFVYGQTAAVLGGTLSFSGTAVGAINASATPYVITPGGLTSANYAISFVNGALTINPKALSVTADNKGKVYNGAVYSDGYSASYSGFVSGEGVANLGGALTFNGTAIAATNAGSYVITPGGLSSTNYAITFLDGTLTIDKRPLGVAADAKDKFFGEADPPLTYQHTSGTFVGSDGFSGNLARAAGEAVGTYAITVGSLTAGPNYQITFTGALLTIKAWTPTGFYAPIGLNNSSSSPTASSSTVWNTVKGGQTVPLKFNVFAASELTDVGVVKTFQQVRVSCPTASGTVEDIDDELLATTGSTSLRYDVTGGQFIQNWATPKVNAETCYRATVTMQDGSSITAFFKLRK